MIDEVERLRDPGLTIKLLVDIAQSRLDDPPLLFAASDAFPGANNLNWVKTLGRVRTIPVLPPSLPELSAAYGPGFVAARMEAFVRFGTLPAVLPALSDPERAAGILRGFVATTLLEDALRARRLRRKDLLLPALKLFAEAIARPLRITALAGRIGCSRDAADRLLTALAMTRVLRLLTPSGLALRWEPDVDETRIPALEKGFMADFADTGVRNAVLDLARGNEGSAFAPLADRPDREALWAAFVRQELSKVLGDVELFGTFSFWQTKRADGSAPPRIIVRKRPRDGRILGYVSAYSGDALAAAEREAGLFQAAAPKAEVRIVTPENLLEVLETAVGSEREFPSS